MNRKRKPNESYELYRKRLRGESALEKERLQGRYLWRSTHPNAPGQTYKKDHGDIES